MDFNKLFKDKDSFPDNSKITLGNGEVVELGVLRAYNDSMQGDLVKELNRQKAELQQEQLKVKRAADEVAKAYLKVQADKAALDAAPKPGSNGRELDPLQEAYDDPIAGAVARELKALRDEVRGNLKTLQEDKVAKLERAVQEMGLTYLNDRGYSQFEPLKADKDFPADLTYDELYQYAVDRGFKEKNGIPNLKRAYEDKVSEKRQARLIKEAEERGAKKAEEKRQQELLLPRPSSAGIPGIAERAAKGAPKNLNEAIAAASQDVEVWTGRAAS